MIVFIMLERSWNLSSAYYSFIQESANSYINHKDGTNSSSMESFSGTISPESPDVQATGGAEETQTHENV